MNIFVGADHNGFELKEQVKGYLAKLGYAVFDAGDKQYDQFDDFPVIATAAVLQMLASEDKNAKAILICGSGQGMLMAANRFKGVRAGLGWSIEAASSIRNDEDSNVIALPSAIFQETSQWQPILDAWLKTPFANAPRFIRRNSELDQI